MWQRQHGSGSVLRRAVAGGGGRRGRLAGMAKRCIALRLACPDIVAVCAAAGGCRRRRELQSGIRSCLCGTERFRCS